jgi:LPS-assembly lipoprotein
MSSSETRRALLRAAPLLLLTGCGFELRRAADLQFDSIALTGFAPRSPMAAELRSALERSVVIKESPAQAQVVLQALTDQRLRKVVAFTASGQVRDIQLRTLLRYRAQTPAERELTFIESRALGKEQEEQDLFREMQSDTVLQVMLRLSTVKV